MNGRYVRIEAGWSADLTQDVIRLRDVNHRPRGEGRWLAGQNERGSMVVAELGDRTPHFLLAGQTGSGKSVAIESAASQLGQDPANHLIMIDGKWGDGLLPVSHLPTLQGPLATGVEDAGRALAWAMGDMRRRYECKASGRRDPSRLVIFWDEPQEWLRDDPKLAAMTRRLSGQGRAVGVHFLIATHHPTTDMFGDKSSKRNLTTGRIALQVADFEASRVAVGASRPRADRLLGAGDSYLIGPGAVQRAQLVLVDQRDFDALPSGEPALDEWPECRAEDWGQEPDLEPFTPRQTAEAIIAAHEGKGRPALEERAGVGSTVGRRLLAYGRDVNEALGERGYALREQSG
jgi:S-DNA-T family DNA segregation ATPase FtsK/SpoIIIE